MIKNFINIKLRKREKNEEEENSTPPPLLSSNHYRLIRSDLSEFIE